jgi:hypothetical protein
MYLVPSSPTTPMLMVSSTGRSRERYHPLKKDHTFSLVNSTKIMLGAMAHGCSPSYIGGRVQEDCGLRPAQGENVSEILFQ